LRQVINETLAKLAYRTVDDDWNTALDPIDPRANAPTAIGTPGRPPAEDLESAVKALRTRIASRRRADLDEITARWPAVAGATVRIIVRGSHGHQEEIRWTPGAGDDGREAMVVATAVAWSSLLEGRSNAVTEITAGRLRCISPTDTHRIRSDEMHAVAALLGFANMSVARTAASSEPAPIDERLPSPA
jgi:hypothetical protein